MNTAHLHHFFRINKGEHYAYEEIYEKANTKGASLGHYMWRHFTTAYYPIYLPNLRLSNVIAFDVKCEFVTITLE